MKLIWAVATKEFQDGLRNRWLISTTLIFAVLSMGLSYYGTVTSGQVGTASLSSTIASLSSLAVFLIPLIALLLAYDSFVGEQESGTLLLLLSYPITHRQLLLGKFLGQGAIISLATCLGFGSAAVWLALQENAQQVMLTFGLFIISSILLGLIFISIAYLISLSVSEKSKAAGLALLTWFFFVLVFDLALLAMLVGIEDGVTQTSLVQLMMFNPTDLFRLVNLSNLDTSDINGVLAVAIHSSLSWTTLIGFMVLWILLPLAGSLFILKGKTL
ncbi:MAG: ABC transporter permease [Gammaproteobacteria bacterium]|nr:ABC transporter permease [Gammaproteobacteria bacterium]MCP4879115.1 ABC transporter permease [Gammaproteobacteria bacterium]